MGVIFIYGYIGSCIRIEQILKTCSHDPLY